MKPGKSSERSEWRIKPIPFRDPHARMETNDKEYKSVLGRPGLRGGTRRTWTLLLICEFEMDGKRYTVTPGYWSTFISEMRVQKFLNRVIASNGECQLWVNPENPLQTELITNDIKDLLLYS